MSDFHEDDARLAAMHGYEASGIVWHHLGWALELEARYVAQGFGMTRGAWLEWYLQ